MEHWHKENIAYNAERYRFQMGSDAPFDISSSNYVMLCCQGLRQIQMQYIACHSVG
jgi:hypothetical protein